MKGGRHIENDKIKATDQNGIIDSLFADCRDAFFDDTDQNGITNDINYPDHFTVFKFGITSNQADFEGAIQKLGIHNAIMFTTPLSDNYTLNHEVMHGFGLTHTHRDTSILISGYKYIFPCGIKTDFQSTGKSTDATDNTMAYNQRTYSLWCWQWKIANPNIT